jgi:hypothetical protein
VSDFSISNPPTQAPILGRDGILSFEDVEQRLIEAILVTWRQPDRERMWLTVRAYWPEAPIGEDGDYGGDGIDGVSSSVLRTASLTRREIADAEQAFGWLAAVQHVDDRRLIGKALRQRAMQGGSIEWLPLWDRSYASVEAMRKRYSRAMQRVVARANRGA